MKSNSGRLISFLFCLVAPLPLAAQGPGGIQLEVVPQTLELDSCETGSPLLVVARNPSAQSAPALVVAYFSDAALALAPAQEPRALAPHQETSWQYQVTCQSGFAAGNLQIVLRSNPSLRAGPAAAQIATRSVTVKLRDPRPLESIAVIDIKSTLESLHSGDKGELALAITNKTAEPLTVTVTPKAVDFIKFSDPHPPAAAEDHTGQLKASTTIAALSTGIVQFTVSADRRLTPGKQILLFEVVLGEGPHARSFLVPREVQVDVLGESEILKLLGVPSLFLLPGFLAVSSFLLFWRWNVWRPTPAGIPPLEALKTDFWVVSVTVSLLITGCFLVIGRKDYFSFYGLGDLMMIWFTSIGFGSAVYLTYRAVINRRNKLNEARYPQPGDSPILILHKLKLHQKTMGLVLVQVKGKDSPLFLLLAEAGSADAYVAPPMIVIWKATADAGVRDQVNAQLMEGGDPETVARLLEAQLALPDASGVKEIKWNDADSHYSSARKVLESDIVTVKKDSRTQTGIILEQKDEA